MLMEFKLFLAVFLLFKLYAQNLLSAHCIFSASDFQNILDQFFKHLYFIVL